MSIRVSRFDPAGFLVTFKKSFHFAIAKYESRPQNFMPISQNGSFRVPNWQYGRGTPPTRFSTLESKRSSRIISASLYGRDRLLAMRQVLPIYQVTPRCIITHLFCSQMSRLLTPGLLHFSVGLLRESRDPLLLLARSLALMGKSGPTIIVHRTVCPCWDPRPRSSFLSPSLLS